MNLNDNFGQNPNMNNMNPNMYQNPYQYNQYGQPYGYGPMPQMQPPKQKDGLATASLVIGIISLVLCLPLLFLIIPPAIIGLILGIVGPKGNGKRTAGIILNSLALAGSILVTLLVVLLICSITGLGLGIMDEIYDNINSEDGINIIYDEDNENQESKKDNPVSGKYDCAPYSSYNSNKNYTISFYLNEDMTFKYGQYGDLENNHASGKYTWEDEHKTNGNKEYKYYMTTLKQDELIVDGEEETEKGVAENDVEFGITTKNGKREGIIMFVRTYNMYYCYER